MDDLKRYFRPEFINRIDEILIFQALGLDLMLEIVDIQVQQLITQLKTSQAIELTVDHDTKTFLAGKGYDPSFGARPLRRAIQRYLQSPLADYILSTTIKQGTKLRTELDGESIQIKPEKWVY